MFCTRCVRGWVDEGFCAEWVVAHFVRLRHLLMAAIPPARRECTGFSRALALAPPPPSCLPSMQTRIQKERFQDRPQDYDLAKGEWSVAGAMRQGRVRVG